MEHTAPRPLAGKRIGIFGKGGSGKSTVAVLLAKGLRAQGYAVCLLDADSTNVGMHRALGLAHSPAPLLDHFGGMVFSGGRVTCPVDDPLPLADAEVSPTSLPDAYLGQSSDDILLLTAGKIGGLGPGAGCDGPIAKIARDLRVHGNGTEPVTLLDFKAGFEDLARGAVTSLDWAVVVVDPTIAAVEMAAHIQALVREVKAGGLPATQHLEDPALVEAANRLYRQAVIKGVYVVMNRVQDARMEHYLRERLHEHGVEAYAVVPADQAIARAWLAGETLKLGRAKCSVEKIIWDLEHAEMAAVQGQPHNGPGAGATERPPCDES
jgi:CO dehydrogenase nickel-insertion accessory protein CooC1